MSSKFSLGKKIGSEMLEDILRENNGDSPNFPKEIHLQRYDTLINEFDLREFSGFLYSVGKMYLRHPIQMYNIFNKKR